MFLSYIIMQFLSLEKTKENVRYSYNVFWYASSVRLLVCMFSSVQLHFFFHVSENVGRILSKYLRHNPGRDGWEQINISV